MADHAQNAFEGMLEYGKSVIKFLFLLNGGAILAILALIGSLAKDAQVPADLAAFIPGIWAFVVGLVMTVAAAATGYFNFQGVVDNRGGEPRLRLTYCLAISFVLGSLTAFLIGICLETAAISGIDKLCATT